MVKTALLVIGTGFTVNSAAHMLARNCYDTNLKCPVGILECPFKHKIGCSSVTKDDWEKVLNKSNVNINLETGE